MQPLNGDQNIKFRNQLWILLTEISLSEFLADRDKRGEITAGALFQMLRDLSMPPENLESIDRMLSDFGNEALMRNKTGRLELPGRIRIFCQHKMLEAADSVQTVRLYTAEQGMEPAQKIHPSGTKMNAGWGCFLVKRGGNVSGDASPSSDYCVDLYLYREG